MYGYHVIGSSVSFHGRSWPASIVKSEPFGSYCDKDFRSRKPIINAAARLSLSIVSSEFWCIQGVGCVGGTTSQDP